MEDRKEAYTLLTTGDITVLSLSKSDGFTSFLLTVKKSNTMFFLAIVKLFANSVKPFSH